MGDRVRGAARERERGAAGEERRAEEPDGHVRARGDERYACEEMIWKREREGERDARAPPRVLAFKPLNVTKKNQTTRERRETERQNIPPLARLCSFRSSLTRLAAETDLRVWNSAILFVCIRARVSLCVYTCVVNGRGP